MSTVKNAHTSLTLTQSTTAIYFHIIVVAAFANAREWASCVLKKNSASAAQKQQVVKRAKFASAHLFHGARTHTEWPFRQQGSFGNFPGEANKAALSDGVLEGVNKMMRNATREYASYVSSHISV